MIKVLFRYNDIWYKQHSPILYFYGVKLKEGWDKLSIMWVKKLENIGNVPVVVTNSKNILSRKNKLSAEVSLSFMISNFGK